MHVTLDLAGFSLKISAFTVTATLTATVMKLRIQEQPLSLQHSNGYLRSGLIL